MPENVTFEELLASSPITLGLDTATPEETIAALVDSLVAHGSLPESMREAALEAVMSRENTSSTAISGGIAIPHGYLDGIDGVLIAIGVHRDGVECGVLDGVPSRVFVLMLNSRQTIAGHIKFLVGVNQRLLRPAVRNRLFLARTREEVFELLTRKD